MLAEKTFLPVTKESPKRRWTLMLVAGEASGDTHGAELIHALQEQRPGIRIIGVGGPKMAAAGQEQLFDLASHAVLGLTQVARHLLKFRNLANRVLKLAVSERPEAVILIDFQGFNLRLATRLRHLLPGSRTIFYVSPQVWASRAGRVKTMSRDIDLLISILPFEKAWYAEAAPHFNVHWVGHPILDRIQRIGEIEPDPNWIALLPGSRQAEIETHLPVLWETARIMSTLKKSLKFILLSPNEEIQSFSLDVLEKQPVANFQFEYNVGYTVSHLSRCSLALVASGTASLECAVVGTPQIVVYKVDPLTWWVGKRVVKVKHLSIVNVMAKEEVVPEFLQDRLQPESVAQEALALLQDTARREAMKQRVERIVATLGGPGASRRAAEAILLEASFARVN